MPQAEQQDELTDYQRVRCHAARHAGLTRLEAARFATNNVPLQTLRRLRDGGCPAPLIARIIA